MLSLNVYVFVIVEICPKEETIPEQLTYQQKQINFQIFTLNNRHLKLQKNQTMEQVYKYDKLTIYNVILQYLHTFF